MSAKTLSDLVHIETRVDLPNHKRIVALPDDMVFVIDTRDNIEKLHDLSNGKGHEPDMIAKMMSFAQGGETYAEVGSHYGDFALRMSQKIGPQGMVYGFEPNKNLYQCFSASVFLNGITNIVSENLAVLDKPQKIGFFEDVQISLMSKIDNSLDNTIMAVTLDDYFKGKESSVSIIRIDAEGSECKILRGAQNIIDSSSNIRLFIEWQSALLNQYETKDSLRGCLSNLLDKGFVLLDTAEFNKNCDYKNYVLDIDDIIDDPVLEVLAVRENTLKSFIAENILDNKEEECLDGLHNLLHLSINRNNIDRAKFAISQIDDLNYLHHIGATAIYWAAQNGKIEIAKLLLDSKVDLEIKTTNNITPLVISVQENKFNMAKLLIESGAFLETPNSLGSTPLFIASYFGYDDILRLLIENGANKNAQVKGVSAFQAALQENHPSAAILLAGSTGNFCQVIQGTEYESKYIGICSEHGGE